MRLISMRYSVLAGLFGALLSCGADRALGEWPRDTNGGAASHPEAGTDPTLGDTLAPLTPLEQNLVDLPADSWLTVANGFGAVCNNTPSEWHSIMGCEGLFAWSGAAWDSQHSDLLLFGGGQGDYSGNEVYAFHVPTMTWERLTMPSNGPYSQDVLADGRPVARSTYDSLVWIESLSRMFAWGGGRATDGFATHLTWLFDPVNRSWVNAKPSDAPPDSQNSSAVYDPIGNRVITKVAGVGLFAYDPTHNSWTSLVSFGSPPYWPRYASGHDIRGTLDRKRRLIWMIGGNEILVYDPARNAVVTDEWTTSGGGAFTNQPAVQGYADQLINTGGGDIISTTAPGLDYDDKADALVAWRGGAPYILDLVSKVWTRGSNTKAPALAHTTGVFGRFRYLSKYNVFLLVDARDAVHFYKHTAGP